MERARHPLFALALALVLPGAVALVLAPAAAHAQSDGAERQSSAGAIPVLIETEEGGREIPSLRLSVGEIEDMEVFGRDDEEIGEVESVLMTTQGEIVALGVELGGFLGLGDRQAIMPIAHFRRVGDILVVEATRGEIGALPREDGL